MRWFPRYRHRWADEPFTVDNFNRSNGLSRFESSQDSNSKLSQIGALLLYGLAIYGGIKFVPDVVIPFWLWLIR